MSIAFQDVEATLMRLLLSEQASGGDLEGIQINYPGGIWRTADVEHWCVPNVEENARGYDRHGQGNGTLNVLIFVRLTNALPYERGRIGESFAAALNGTSVAIKNYETGDGTSTLGTLRFFVGTIAQAPLPDEGFYTANFAIPYLVSGGS